MCSVNSARVQIYLKIESSGNIKISQSRDKNALCRDMILPHSTETKLN